MALSTDSQNDATTSDPTSNAAIPAHLSITSISSIRYAQQNQTQRFMSFDNCFKRLMNIECIKDHIDIEFEKFGSFRLFRAFFTLYIISLIDIVTDILLAFSITNSAVCIKIIMGDGAFVLIVITAWFSTLTAVIYSFYFKYIKAFKVMHRYKISFWSSIKYVSLYTALKCDMQYQKLMNDTNRYRLMALFFEDALQFAIALLISFYIPKADIFVILSMYLSATAICYHFAKMIQWEMRDYIRKNAKRCFQKCASLGINKVCNIFCKFVIFGGIAFAVVLLLLIPIWRSYERFEQTVYADYGFIIADIRYNIEYLHINIINNTHQYEDFYEITSVDLTTTIDEDTRYLCIDANLDEFNKGVHIDETGMSVNDDSRSKPVTCFKVNKRKLLIWFIYDTFAQCYESKNELKWTENGHLLEQPNDFIFYQSWNDDQDSAQEMSFDGEWKISYSSTNTAFCDDF